MLLFYPKWAPRMPKPRGIVVALDSYYISSNISFDVRDINSNTMQMVVGFFLHSALPVYNSFISISVSLVQKQSRNCLAVLY